MADFRPYGPSSSTAAVKLSLKIRSGKSPTRRDRGVPRGLLCAHQRPRGWAGAGPPTGGRAFGQQLRQLGEWPQCAALHLTRE